MIDKSKIDIFLKYKGFYEGFYRKYRNKDEKPMSDDDWFLIHELITESSLVLKGLTSEEFEKKLNKKLVESCIDKHAIAYLKESSSKKIY